MRGESACAGDLTPVTCQIDQPHTASLRPERSKCFLVYSAGFSTIKSPVWGS
jgi:hypothetical protein